MDDIRIDYEGQTKEWVLTIHPTGTELWRTKSRYNADYFRAQLLVWIAAWETPQ